jgi:hypothetical protein
LNEGEMEIDEDADAEFEHDINILMQVIYDEIYIRK